MASIKPIVGSSVHQIQSGQVIVDLCSVVKELVENSLDAHATSIDVRFKNHGLESIEVQDNGSGILKEDYENIALKHFTSKLSTYDDLSTLKTFGFRGEALSSLCAVSHLHINTARQEEAPKGTRLDFEPCGKLKGTRVIASHRGTTVVVESIFTNLPVRRQELARNIKREYSKVLGLLQAYACISTNVKFSVSNTTGKGKRTVAFATQPNKTSRENIANVFGAKTLGALLELDLAFKMEKKSSLRLTQNADGWNQVRVNGHVSKPIFGEGRQTPDRQMFFVNARPCSLPQVAKVINEVYKSFNSSQSPFIFANVLLDTNAYDVNVSPDKRTILLHDQSTLLETLRTSLTELFDNQEQTIPQSLTRLQPTITSKSLIPKNATPSTSARSAASEKAAPFRKTGIDRDGNVQCDISDESTLPQNNSPWSDNLEGKAGNILSKFGINGIQSGDANGTSWHETTTVSRPSWEHRRLSSPNVDREDIGCAAEGAEANANAVSAAKTVRGARQLLVDFNEQLVNIQPTLSEGQSSPSSGASSEPGIPSISCTSTKASPGVVPYVFECTRPLHTPLQKAEITIDDKVFTSIIGNQPAQQRSRFTVTAPRSKATPKRTPLASHNFGQALNSFRATNPQENSPTRLEINVSEDDEGGGESADYEDTIVHVDEEEDHDVPQQNPESAESNPKSSRNTLSRSQSGGSSTNRQQSRAKEASNVQIDDDLCDATASEAISATNNVREDTENSGGEYLVEATKKARENAKIARLIQEAEEKAPRPTEDENKQAQKILKSINRKASTFNLSQMLETSVHTIDLLIRTTEQSITSSQVPGICKEDSLSQIEANTTAEDRLSLTVSKTDFGHMRIVGQFNLGFIIALRPSSHSPTDEDVSQAFHPKTSELFIIDQHASDEKSNFESLQLSTTVQAQPLVNAFPLSLTAIEEEVIIENQESFTKNGFVINVDETGDSPVGQRCKLLALPMSKELTFDLRDLEELIALLAESSNASYTKPVQTRSDDDDALRNPSLERTMTTTRIVRPTKVRKMFAMRACRSSIMVGKSLSHRDMRNLVKRMGMMDKPWNCPHGRPTMRHLVGLDRWKGWMEGDGLWDGGDKGDCSDAREVEGNVDWRAWIRQ